MIWNGVLLVEIMALSIFFFFSLFPHSESFMLCMCQNIKFSKINKVKKKKFKLQTSSAHI